jgi:hypothetical protein
MCEGINSGLVGNAFYHTVHNILSFGLLCKNVNIKTHKTITLPVVLYGCENWSLKSRKNTILEFKNWVLRRIFGPKRDEATGNWRKLRNEHLHILHSSSNRIRMSTIKKYHTGRAFSANGRDRKHKNVVAKTEGNRPHGRFRGNRGCGLDSIDSE